MQSRADNRDALDVVYLMRRAMRAAVPHFPHPNPRVGAVLVDDLGRVLAESGHAGPGAPHAERVVLEAAGDAAHGSTVVVTLEPCVHHGRTPPCADALVEAGVARVVVGAVDPDPRVSGSGLARLRSAGIEVIDDVLTEEIVALDPGYFHHRTVGRPRVTLKLAATLDGQTAAADGSSQWITSSEARIDAHRLRSESDAVAIGAGTLLADDPRLTVRLDDHTGPQPMPIVIAGTRPLPPSARLFEGSALVYTPQGALELPPDVEQVAMPSAGLVDLESVVKDLGTRGVLDLLVEGGATLARAMLEAGLVDRIVLYLAGSVAGGVGRPMFDGTFATLSDLRPLEIVGVAQLGPDVRIEAVPRPEGR